MAYDFQLYIHDMDKKAFKALNQFPKFVHIQEELISGYDEKLAKIQYLSNAIRLSENQMPEIYNLLPPICDKLGIKIPELYYEKSKDVNAYTIGVTEPIIVVTSSLVRNLSNELISTVLAHECGHIACRHYLYRSLANQILKKVDTGVSIIAPKARRLITPTFIRALEFWSRCSELSADRAAVLCDGNANNTADVLLNIHGYNKNINREEFIKQAYDLKNYINESKENRMIEKMISIDDSHPRMAIRVYESQDWAKSSVYKGIIDGTYSISSLPDSSKMQDEIVSAEVEVANINGIDLDTINEELDKVNQKLERYTNNADKTDYAIAIACGILSGVIDAIFVKDLDLGYEAKGLANKNVNQFIEKYAIEHGIDGRHLKDFIRGLEDKYKVAQDNVWKGEGISVSASNHHLADLAHHPTPLGLVSAIIVQFARVGIFVNKDGEWNIVPVKTSVQDALEVYSPVIITAILNWLVSFAEDRYEEETERDVPDSIHKIAHTLASTPLIIEIIQCLDNWVGHMVSDMGGSKNTAGKGMGIPGVFVSLLYEISSLPGLKDSGLPKFVNTIYEKQKIDLRDELPVYESLGSQAIPVIFNDLLVRTIYFITRIANELSDKKSLKDVNWNLVLPWKNRTVDRMIMISSMTFNFADTADAAFHAALESGGNGVLFAGKFVTRYNYIGAGKAAFSIVREVSNEFKEAELIREKLILKSAQTELVLQKLEEYKTQLETQVSNYLAEDIESFMRGFDMIQDGLVSGNSDFVIGGNVVIQKVLGRDPQFTNQEEFDTLMLSEDSFKL